VTTSSTAPTGAQELAPGAAMGAAPPGRGAAARGRVSRGLNQYAGVLSVLAVLVVYLSLTQENFLSPTNFANVLDTASVTLIVAVALTFTLLIGAIDLSIGAIIALTATTLWELITRTSLPVPVSILLAVTLAFALGFFVNGLLIGRVGLSFLVVTIATAYLFRGVAKLRTAGQDQSVFGVGLLDALRDTRLLGLPLTVWVAGAVFLVGLLVLRYTGFGRMVYAVGGNPEAARLAGINVTMVRVSVFGIAGALAGIASVVDVSRTTSASPNAQLGIELIAGAAVLLGGTSFMGGRGTLLGSLLGVLFLGILSNGLTLASVSSYWADVVSGVVLVAAIAFDRWRNGTGTP